MYKTFAEIGCKLTHIPNQIEKSLTMLYCSQLLLLLSWLLWTALLSYHTIHICIVNIEIAKILHNYLCMPGRMS